MDRPRRWLLIILMLAGVTTCLAQSPPSGEGVLLPKAEYDKLLQQAEQSKKAKPARPLPPSVCRVLATLKPGERPTVGFTVTYQFQTTQPHTTILLGGLKAFAVAAKNSDGSTPVLEPTADGLTAIIATVGEQTITVTYEAAVAPRAANDVGAGLSLPRAAITTLAFTKNPGVKGLTLATRLPDAAGKPGEMKSATLDGASLTDAMPLGPTDTLDLSWDAPGSTAPPTEATLDIDAAIRVDDRTFDITATLRLRGPQREWTLTLPVGMTLAAADVTQLRPPADPKTNTWTVTLPAGTVETALTATQRQPRSDTKPPVPYAFGPLFAKGTVRTGGTIRVFAPVNLRLVPKLAADVRRVDAPATGDENPTAVFKFANLLNLDKKPTPLLELDTRPATGFVIAQPQHQLTLTSNGWRLRCIYRVSPVRTAVETVTLDLPAGWQDPAFAPLDLVDEVQGGGDSTVARQLTVRLVSPQREPFELTLDARRVVEVEERQTSLPLPRLTQYRERDTQVSVFVPDAFAVTGTVREGDINKPTGNPSDFSTATGSRLAGRFEGGIARVDVAWQPAAPRSVAEIVADVVVSDRQAVITQTMTFDFPDGVSRTIRLRGPTAPAGFRSTPALTAVTPGEWTYQAASSRATLTLSYAVPVTFDTSWPVPLVSVDSATVATTVRIGGTVVGRRANAAVGRWRDAAPEPMPDRDTLPWLTLKSSEAAAPLSVTWAEADTAGSVLIDRAVQQIVLSDNLPQQHRTRFLLKRWPGTLEVEVPGNGPVAVFVDKQRIEPVLKQDAGTTKTLAVSLPEARAVRSGLILEVRHAGLATTVPTLRGAVMRGGLWRQITCDPGTLPFVPGHASPEIHWHWRDGLLTPQGAVTDANLDQWLAEAAEIEPGTGSSTLSLYSPDLAPLSLHAVPRLPAFVVGGVLALAVGFGLRRLSPRWRPLAIIILVIVLFVAAFIVPALMVPVAYVLQPGIILAIVVVSAVSVVQSWRQARDVRAATFSRGRPVRPESTPAVDLSAKSNRPASVPASAS